jgi:type I restriction enzyme M protein
MPKLTQQQLEADLLKAASILRGNTAGQDYKTYILTLLFLKRLSDQWEYERDVKVEQAIAELQARWSAPLPEDKKAAIRANPDYHRFAIPDGCLWDQVRTGEAPLWKQGEHAGASLSTRLTLAGRLIARAERNKGDLTGVFTVDWALPAPDGAGTLIAGAVVTALVNHISTIPLSNAYVEPDVLGRAYEYLIKYFADDAGEKAGEFFTPPQVVDTLIRILEPAKGDSVYDPTCGSGGMLIHSADFLKEHGARPSDLTYFGQEKNWGTYPIARINVVLHELEAQLVGGKSTLLAPGFLEPDGRGGSRVQQFSVVISNFPFSDSEWTIADAKETVDEGGSGKKKGARKAPKKEAFVDPYSRFGFGDPPSSSGDWAFIQHIIASMKPGGRAGVVCPQGVLFRGQAAVEEETGELAADGTPKVRRRKADDEYLIRKGVVDAKLIEAIIALPLNIFYGAGVPAALLILRKDRPAERSDKILMIYGARHFEELAAQNRLRRQDVLRLLVHYHAFGEAGTAARVAAAESARMQGEIEAEFQTERERIVQEYPDADGRLAEAVARAGASAAAKSVDKLEKQVEALRRKVVERDERVAELRRRSDYERAEICAVVAELLDLYARPEELGRHARVVGLAEVEENEFNLNIPRYVDTFEPESPILVSDVLRELQELERCRSAADAELVAVLREAGFGT